MNDDEALAEKIHPRQAVVSTLRRDPREKQLLREGGGHVGESEHESYVAEA